MSLLKIPPVAFCTWCLMQFESLDPSDEREPSYRQPVCHTVCLLPQCDRNSNLDSNKHNCISLFYHLAKKYISFQFLCSTKLKVHSSVIVILSHAVNPTIVFTSHLAAHMNKNIIHFYLLHTEKGSLTPKAAFFLFVLCSFHSFMRTHFVLFLPCFTLYSCFARF